jgi:hypothetical protein
MTLAARKLRISVPIIAIAPAGENHCIRHERLPLRKAITAAWANGR